jgi:hypothetical protein
MIRRDAPSAASSPAWILISQIEHAHLAGDLARHWGEAPNSSLPFPDILLPTIDRHDDGWRDWEAAPTIDPIRGRPRSFLEMPNDVAHEIWAKSIDGVADLGPLAQYVVAQHFIRLRRSGGEIGDQQIAAFLDEYERRSHDWLADWQAASPTTHSRKLAEAAVGYLQMFDAVSLWLCSGPSKRKQISSPDGIAWTLTPVAGGKVVAAPWPWKIEPLRVHAIGWRIPASPLASDEELRTRLKFAEKTELNWSVVRKE